MKFTIFFFLLMSNFFSCRQQKKNSAYINLTINNSFIICSEAKNYFDACGVNGSIAIFDNYKQQWVLSDTVSVFKENLPASTFKIVNLLIALETKVIKDENEIIKWKGETDTLKYGYRQEIYHDMTVKEAFEVSAGWVFIELAKKVGKNNYEKYLSLCKYGNAILSHNETDFWNFGDFAISPVNQVEFVKNLHDLNLPFSKRNMEIVKKVMVVEQNENYTICAKTGWTRAKNINTGWWVGYLETKTGVCFFATLLIQDRRFNRDDFGACRKEITKKVFKTLKIIK